MRRIVVTMAATFMLLNSRLALPNDTVLISLENVSTGYVLTEYYDYAGAQEYVYPPYAYSSSAMEQRKQLFSLDYTTYNKIPAIQFKSNQTGRCLTKINSGVVSAACGMQDGNYWEMIYTSTGAVQLKNFSGGECLVSTNASQSYAGISVTPCAKNGEVALANSLWILTVPRNNASVSY